MKIKEDPYWFNVQILNETDLDLVQYVLSFTLLNGTIRNVTSLKTIMTEVGLLEQKS